MTVTPSHGFDEHPQRHQLVTFGLFLVVVAASAGVAVGFKEAAHWLIEAWGGSGDPTSVADRFRWLVTGVVVAAVTIGAAVVGRGAEQRWPGQSGLDAIAATARGETRRISLRATLFRSAATFVSVVGLVPIGRESAIIETGGAIGSTLGRRFRGRGASMATAGIAAGFATAYHAPIGAVLYLEEHLRIRGSRRAVRFAIGGAVGGFLVATQLLGAGTILPRTDASSREFAVAGLIAVVPAAVTARMVLLLRTRATARHEVERRRPVWQRIAITGGVSGLVVAAFPMAAGNGLETLREASVPTAASVGLAVAMLVGKLVGTTSAFAAGAPGGALMPTVAAAAGSALLVVAGLQGLGVTSVDPSAVVVMSAGVAIAIGLRAPLTAVVLVPEMMGQLALVPATAAVVLAAVVLERVFDRLVVRLQPPAPSVIQDEDG